MNKIIIILIFIASIEATEFIFDLMSFDNESYKRKYSNSESYLQSLTVEPNILPYHVALEVQLVDILTSQIGGTIINPHTVLAGARYIQNCTTVIVIAGVHNRSAIEPTQQRRVI
ncbi:hypothetical protein ACKWTF_011550 [Chironomus riparius]